MWGADCEALELDNDIDGIRKRPIHIAADAENFLMCEFLTTWNCNINSQDTKGWTALHYAVSRDNVKLVQYLVRKNANLNISDSLGNTPLALALSNEQAPIVTVLRLYQINHTTTKENEKDDVQSAKLLEKENEEDHRIKK